MVRRCPAGTSAKETRDGSRIDSLRMAQAEPSLASDSSEQDHLELRVDELLRRAQPLSPHEQMIIESLTERKAPTSSMRSRREQRRSARVAAGFAVRHVPVWYRDALTGESRSAAMPSYAPTS